jgi:hypothetical protein
VAELVLQRLAASMVQPMDGGLGPAHPPADLCGSEADDMSHQNHFALVGG